MKKKKDTSINDAAFFFLVAVISVSLSVFVSEVKSLTGGNTAQVIGAVSTSAAGLEAQIEALTAQIATISPTTQAIIVHSDYSLLVYCFYKTKTLGGICSITDFNADGVTNAGDLALAKNNNSTVASANTLKYDLNGDGGTSYTNGETISGIPSDMVLFKSCFFKTSPLSGICALSDFNSDKTVNFADLALLKVNNGATSQAAIAKYDLNSDGKVSYVYDVDIEPTTTVFTDYNLFQYCLSSLFSGQPRGICSLADFNSDGVVGQPDYTLFLGALKYDLNGDRVVEFSDGTTTGIDLSFMRGCLGQPVTGTCARVNFYSDDSLPVIGPADLVAFKSVAAYDLNGDGKVSYSSVTLLGTSTVSDLTLLKSCFFKTSPLTGVCAHADFNGDGVINFSDLALFKQNLSSRDPLALQKYDLNGDGRIWWAVVDPVYDRLVLSLGSFTGTVSSYGQNILIGNYQRGEYIKGLLDFTGDGKLDIADITLAQRAELGIMTWTNLINKRDNPIVRVMGASSGYTLSDVISKVVVGDPAVTLSPEKKQLLDLNGDGAVNTVDARLAERAQNGEIPWIELINTRDSKALQRQIFGASTSISLAIRESSLNLRTLTPEQKKLLDFSGDGIMNGTDGVLAGRAEANLFRWMDLIKQRDSFVGTTVAPTDTPPRIVLYANPTVVTMGGSVTLTASTWDDKGISGVVFMVNGIIQKAGTLVDPIDPAGLRKTYNLSWTPPGAGAYIISSTVLDTTGQVTKSNDVSVVVSNSTTSTTDSPPIVSLTAWPTTITPGTITLVMPKVTDDKGVVGVQINVNGAPYGPENSVPPYTLSFGPTVPGSYTITATARDTAGQKTTSNSVTVTVPEPASPSSSVVSLTAWPTSVTTGTVSLLMATASDSDGIAGVQFYVNDALYRAESTVAPYTISFAPVTSGEYTIKAVARDNAGNKTTSNSVTVTVSDLATDAFPTISLSANTTPVSNGTNVTLTATAADDKGVAGVQFLVNGANFAEEDTTFPYGMSWVQTIAGKYTVSAIARDTAGQKTTSNSTSVDVYAAPPPSGK